MNAPTPHKSFTHRLYTEGYPNVRELVSRYFDAATLSHGIGIWQGKTEDSMIVEVIAPQHDLVETDLRMRKLARDIMTENRQAAVLYTVASVAVENLTLDSPVEYPVGSAEWLNKHMVPFSSLEY